MGGVNKSGEIGVEGDEKGKDVDDSEEDGGWVGG